MVLTLCMAQLCCNTITLDNCPKGDWWTLTIPITRTESIPDHFQKSFWHCAQPISTQRTTENIKRAAGTSAATVTTTLFLAALGAEEPSEGHSAVPSRTILDARDRQGRGRQHAVSFTASPGPARQRISCAPALRFRGYLLNTLYPESFVS